MTITYTLWGRQRRELSWHKLVVGPTLDHVAVTAQCARLWPLRMLTVSVG